MAKAPTGKPASAKGTLHAPLEMKSRTHEELADAAKGGKGSSKSGAKLAKAAHHKRAQSSAFGRLATLAAMPLVLLLVFGAYTYLWFSGASTVRELGKMAALDQDGDGWAVTTSDPKISGFPLSVKGAMGPVKIVAPARWGGWTWAADQLQVSVKPWSLHKPSLHAVGKSTLTTADGATYEMSADALDLLLSLDKQDRVNGITLTGRALKVQPAGGVAPLLVGALDVDARALPLPLVPAADSHTPTYEGHATISDTSVPPDMAPPVGPVLRLLDVSGRLLGPLGSGSLREQMTKWRDDGGVAEVDRFYLDWGPLKLAATGTLALDDRMQPVGALSSQLQGFFEAAESLYKAKVMRARDLTLSRVVLGTMAENKNGVPTLTIPMSLQGGQMILGPVTVMEVPKIAWPGPAAQRDLPSLRPSYQVDRWGNLTRQD